MQTSDLIIAAVLISVTCICLVVCMILCARIVRGKGEKPKERGVARLRAWWKLHRPTKRRLIQVYAALLVNANIKGFVTGSIYAGNTKYLCSPGLNCYSCPGAVGACPLGALQNALAASGTRAPFYVLGILMLYGMLLGRTICGFLCPVGLGQDLLYKIKTPKVKKNKFTRLFSYLKYVLLALLVVMIPVMFGLGNTAVPAFCKYICPAGTLGGAIGLLANPKNADLFGMLGALFTWKFALLVAAVVACMFIYRFFCRFLCPLGALYGLFNRFALLGVKLDRNKCTDCGLCVAHCKMDIAHVGDRECINCGECIAVCPAHAISWKGSKLFVHKNAVEPVPAVEERPLSAFLQKAPEGAPEGADLGHAPLACGQATAQEPAESFAPAGDKAAKDRRKKRPAGSWMRIAAWAAALLLLAGALIYYNFIRKDDVAKAGAPYSFTVTTKSGHAGVLAFSISSDGEGAEELVSPVSGSGTQGDPFELASVEGRYEVSIPAEGEGAAELLFNFSVREDTTYRLISASDDLSLKVFYRDAAGEAVYVATVEGVMETHFELTASPEGMPVYGNGVGDLCYDFALPTYGEGGVFRLSAHRGKLVLINFWYTDCGPCKGEMPLIDDLAKEYADQMDVVAIHSAYIYTDPKTMEGVQAWLNENSLGGRDYTWAQSSILFAQDNGAGLYSSETYALLGGKSSYPFTVLVDADGFVRYKRQGSLQETAIRGAIEALLSPENH